MRIFSSASTFSELDFPAQSRLLHSATTFLSRAVAYSSLHLGSHDLRLARIYFCLSAFLLLDCVLFILSVAVTVRWSLPVYISSSVSTFCNLHLSLVPIIMYSICVRLSTPPVFTLLCVHNSLHGLSKKVFPIDRFS